jgi:integrin beta 8
LTVRNGSGAPSAGLGVNGDFYIDTAANTIYGPKTAGAWGSPISLVGPTGATGATGNTGPQGPSGIASPAAIVTLASPVGGQGGSFSDVLSAGAVTIGAGGNVFVQVYFTIIATGATLDGLYVRIQNDTDATTIQPKNNANTSVNALNTTNPCPFFLQAYQTGLTPASSKTYKLQASSEGGISGGTSIQDAVIAVWTW